MRNLLLLRSAWSLGLIWTASAFVMAADVQPAAKESALAKLPAGPSAAKMAESLELNSKKADLQKGSGESTEPQDTAARTIGTLAWHMDYSTAYREARRDQKMLWILFRDDRHPQIADSYERDVLAHADLHKPLADVVRCVLPLEYVAPATDADEDQEEESEPVRLVEHKAFEFMYRRQGIAVIDLTEEDGEHYGHVVSAHPFSAGKHLTLKSTQVVLGLPKGSVTQRALVYAVRIHPQAPVSTTDGKCNSVMCKHARRSSQLMANYEAVGHHEWGNRYAEVAQQTGMSASEVAASSWGQTTLQDAAQQCVDSWHGSPAHWGIMISPARIFGYDLVRSNSGVWYGTGLYAN